MSSPARMLSRGGTWRDESANWMLGGLRSNPPCENGHQTGPMTISNAWMIIVGEKELIASREEGQAARSMDRQLGKFGWFAGTHEHFLAVEASRQGSRTAHSDAVDCRPKPMIIPVWEGLTDKPYDRIFRRRSIRWRDEVNRFSWRGASGLMHGQNAWQIWIEYGTFLAAEAMQQGNRTAHSVTLKFRPKRVKIRFWEVIRQGLWPYRTA